MTFKEQVAHDNRTVFMNLDEFSDLHMVNGKEMTVQFDSNEMIDREKRYQYKRSLYADGVYMKEILIYVNAEEFGKLPAIGRILTLDGKTYTISDAVDEDGIYSLCLEANKTGGK
ncbi:hypothetical protein D7X48_20825 [bacterium D16-50]|nr:hypothetical protein D7X48_20825 [bacterium D16-50]